MEKIPEPKVFISYAWASEEYKDKVLAFAYELARNAGIDVVLDRWDLKEGQDKYAFMEQCVNDPTITNVLILLDPAYEEKANNREGGVGTETQIISPEVYNKIKQEKFLPVVFERKEDGSIPKPWYLSGTLHFDLSQEATYDNEYQRLVNRLYGEEVIIKPKPGKKPDWVGKNILISTKTRIAFDALKKSTSDDQKKEEFKNFLLSIKDQIVNFNKDGLNNNLSADEYLALYKETKTIRDKFLFLMKYTIYVSESYKFIASTLEDICQEIKTKNDCTGEAMKTLLHEMFIYVIAIYWKSKNYQALSHILTKTYFAGDHITYNADSFKIFYCRNDNLNQAMSQKDGRNYHSGTAEYWINNINIDTCNKNEFVFADILCYNAAIFVENYKDEWRWFPITYIYANENSKNLFRQFAFKLKSKEHLKETSEMFGFPNIEAFIKKYIKIEAQIKAGDFNEYRYPLVFESAPVICKFVNSKELGSWN